MPLWRTKEDNEPVADRIGAPLVTRVPRVTGTGLLWQPTAPSAIADHADGWQLPSPTYRPLTPGVA